MMKSLNVEMATILEKVNKNEDIKKLKDISSKVWKERNIQGKKNKYIPNENIYSLSPSKKQRRHNSNTFHNFEQFVVLNHKKNKKFFIKLTVPFK